VHAQRFDSAGIRVGGEFLVNSHTLLTQKSPRVATSDGGFVIVWQSFGQDDPSDYGIFGRRFGSDGSALAVEFQVNQVTFQTQWRPDVAMGAGGDFAVVWDAFQDGDFRGIVARRFDSSGAGQAVEFVVNTHTPNDQRSAAIAKDPAGAFVVVWSSYVDGSSYDDMRARFFDSTGVAEGGEFQVNAATAPKQFMPSVAALGENRFVVAWESALGAGDYDVFARRVEPVPLATLDVDGNQDVDALTDGLLVIRELFGFSGSALTNGALGAGCTRCTGAQITAYLDGLGLVLDADDDEDLTALTDGLLILRFLFGFTGSALTTGAVDLEDCERCEPAEVAGYLQSLL
jgi:hypothetical protein